MRKLYFLLIAIVLIIVMIGLAPWLDGIMFKKNYLNLISIINQDNRLKVDVLEYDVGWFSSYAKIQVTHASPSFIAEKSSNLLTFTLENTISHGPFIFDKAKDGYILACASLDSFVHLPPHIETKVLGIQGAQGLMQINTLVTFGGDWINKIQMPMWNISVPSGLGIMWQGLNSEIKFTVGSDEINKIDAKGHIGSITIQGSPQNSFSKMVIQPITYDKQAILQPIGLWDGTGHLVVPNISISQQNGSTIVVDNLVSDSAFGITDETYHFDSQIFINNLLLPNYIITQVSPLKIALSIQGINTQGVSDLMKYLQSMRASQLPQWQSMQENMQNYVNLFTHLITPTSSFTEDVVLNTALGGFEGNIKLYWTPNIPTPTTLRDIELNINVVANLKIAISLVDKLIDASDQYFPAQAPAVQVLQQTNPQVNNGAVFNQAVVQLMQQGKISLALSTQIIAMSDAHVAAADFNANIDKLGLTPDISSELKLQYQMLQAKNAQAMQVNTPTSPSSSPQTKAEMLRKMLNGWLEEGYVIKDNNDYVVSAIRQGGTLKVNGKVVPSIN